MKVCITTDDMTAMKRIASIALVALMLLASADVFAQGLQGRNRRGSYTPGEAGIGLTFGYANSSYRTRDRATDETENTGLLHGFTAGITKDFTLMPHALYFQTGLNYIYQNDPRNENVTVAGQAVKLVGDREEHYLGLPLRLKYDLHLVDNIGLTFDAGATLLLGLSSKYKYRTRFSDDEVASVDYSLYTGKVKSSGDGTVFDLEKWMEASGMYPEGNLGRFDVMLGASVGAHFFHILEVRAGYDWGVVNRYKKEVAEQYAMHRGQFTLSVGLRF